MSFYRLFSRLKDFLVSSLYRRVLTARIIAHLLRKLCPEIKFIGLENQSGKLFLFIKDNVITPYSIAMKENFQTEDLSRALQICTQKGQSLRGLFLDVGANIGTATLAALASKHGYFSGAMCFEPEPNNLQMLRLNLRENHLDSKVKIIGIAIGASKSKLHLMLSNHNFGDHRLSLDLDKNINHENHLEVEVNSLENILYQENIPPNDVSLVWIDTQGFDGFVLKGAMPLFAARVPFCVEMCPDLGRVNGAYEMALEIIESKCENFYDLGSPNWQIPQVANTVRNYLSFLENTDKHTDLLIFPK